MEQYIKKSALVAEIESKKKYAQTLGDNAINNSMQQFYDGMKQGCVDLLSFIDTLEVKVVDLDKEIKKVQRKYKTIEEYEGYPYTMYANNIECIAKHFFELGIKVAQKEELYDRQSTENP